MKCKICGAELKKDGDICNKCYAEYVKDEEIKEEIKEDKNVVLRLHRKFIPIYEISKFLDILIFIFIYLFVLLMQKQFLWFILTFAITFVVLYLYLSYTREKCINTTCTFYDKRIVWKYKDTIKTIDYDNLEDIGYYQKRYQKRHNLADLQFRPLKGIYLTTGFEIKNIPNFKETWEKIVEIVNSKRDN